TALRNPQVSPAGDEGAIPRHTRPPTPTGALACRGWRAPRPPLPSRPRPIGTVRRPEAHAHPPDHPPHEQQEENEVMKKIALARGAAGLVAVGIAASASASVKVENAKCDVGVLLPDSKSSVRWETQDRPDLQKALKAQGLKACITNAQGVAQTQRT